MINPTVIKIALLSTAITLGGMAASAKPGDAGAMFEKIDTNADGQVTQDELRAHAATRFSEADADGDGFLTPEEMLSARGSERAQRMLERLDTDGNGQLSAAELEAAGKDRGEKRATRMMDRLDANDDGKLSLEEMTARRDPAKMFERLDADNNGSLSAEEFAAAREHGKGKRMGHHKKGEMGEHRKKQDN